MAVLAPRKPPYRGFTLIELMVVIAVLAVVAVLAAPSFQDMIVMQRLRGTNAQLVTDLQLARSEAATRGRPVRVNLGSNSEQTCYVIYVAAGNGTTRCDCTRGAGHACIDTANSTEIRTVAALRSSQVGFAWPAAQDSAFAFDHVTGGLITIPSDTESSPLGMVQIDSRIDDDRMLRNRVSQTGRPTVCSLNASRMQVAAC